MATCANILSICSGVGLLDLGIRLAINSCTVCYVEREITAAAILESRFEDGTLDEAPIWSDVATFDGKQWRGKVDIVAGGIPCQPFSVAGKRNGNADERAIAPSVLRIVAECLPSVVFIENVPPWVLRGFAAPFLDRLHDMGYEIAPPFFCRASDFGAPHRRERVFVMAYRDGDGLERVRQSGIHELEDACRYEVERRGFDLADATNKQHERNRGAWGRRRGPSDDGLDLGDAEGGRLEGSNESSAGEAKRGVAVASANVGDADIPRLEDGRPEPIAGPFPSAWPPGPADDWSGVEPELWPATAKPDVRGMVNGRANRVDRLRAAGNGVVPCVVASAFRTLFGYFDSP